MILWLFALANLLCRLAEKIKTSPQVEELLERVKVLLADKESLERRHRGCTSAADLDRLLAERDQAHAGKLQKEKDEVLRLKGELEKLKKEHAKEIEQVTLACEQTISEQKELTDKAVKQVSSAQKELDALAGKQKVWLSELVRTQSAMYSKSSASLILLTLILMPTLGLILTFPLPLLQRASLNPRTLPRRPSRIGG